jgi:hypothetical protein
MKKVWIIYPFLFAVFPVLFLFAYNITEVPYTDIFVPLVVAIIATLFLLIFFRLITRSYYKSGVITACFLFLFFSFGHVRDVLISVGISGFNLGNTSISTRLFLGPVWALLFITGTLLIIKARYNFITPTKILNIIAITMVFISLINIGIYGLRTADQVIDRAQIQEAAFSPDSTEGLPDIYYIILDAYARQDTLKEVYGYDNSDFLDYLTDKGFYVATKSNSNYGSTDLSMPSSLNMDYLTTDELANSETRFEMIENNRVSRFLKEKGYRYIFVGGGIDWKGMAQYTDEYFVYKSGSLLRKTDFMNSLAHTTALSPFLIFFEGFFGDNDRKARLYAFDKISDLANTNRPLFVYADIMSPHPPFIFDSEGNPPKHNIFVGTGNIWQSLGHEKHYIDQLVFTNKKTAELIDRIILKSETPPIIILQADHGIWWIPGEGKKILNAYYLPGKDSSSLYDTISPVNTFRLIFNIYFNADYKLLEDERADYKLLEEE